MIILNNKAYYNAQDKLECYYPYGTQSTSVIYVSYSADDHDFDSSNYVDKNTLLEFDGPEYTEDYERWGFYTIKGSDKKWRILQLDMKWVLPEGIASKSAGIINALKPFLDYEKILKEVINETNHRPYADTITKALRNAIQSDSSTGKRVRVKKIMIDFPAYMWKKPESGYMGDVSLLSDGYRHYPYKAYDVETDSCIGIDGYNNPNGQETGWRPPIPDEKTTYDIGTENSCYRSPSVYHTHCVYPDDEYWPNEFPDLKQWLTWLNDNRQKIAQAKFENIEIPSEIHNLNDLRLQCYPEIYRHRLNNLVAYIKSMEELKDYGFGILLDNFDDSTVLRDQPVSIALYAGDYYKLHNTFKMDTIKYTWFDLTYSLTELNSGSGGRSYSIGFDQVMHGVNNRGLTIGFKNVITESEFLNKPPVLLVTAAPTNRYDTYINDQAPLKVKKLNNEPLTYIRDQGGYHFASTWNIYSEIVLPYDLFHVKGNDSELYNTYAFGEELKYRKRFKSSPVFTYPLFTGYYSHRLGPLEGIAPGTAR